MTVINFPAVIKKKSQLQELADRYERGEIVSASVMVTDFYGMIETHEIVNPAHLIQLNTEPLDFSKALYASLKT